MEKSARPQRIEALDLIRGIAICGLAPINILDFATPDDWMFAPSDFSGIDVGLWMLVSVAGMGKFVSLFSILFGASMILQTCNLEARGKPVARSYLPRLGWLWFFGMLHGYLIWWGDILVGYAVTGFVVFWCRGWSARVLGIVGAAVQYLFIAIVSLLILLIFLSGNSGMLEQELEEATEDPFWNTGALTGSWLDQMPIRAAVTWLIHVCGIPFVILPFCGSMMLLGMSLYKSGFFEHKWRSGSYRRVLVWTLFPGLAISIPGMVFSYIEGWTATSIVKHAVWGIFATPLIAIGYATVLVLWSKGTALRWLQSGFQAIGRMAFSNYIGQSIIFSLIFYGDGLGMYGKLSLSSVLMICPAVWIFQMAVSSVWLLRFRFGPLEWLWRRLSSGEKVPMVR